MGTEVFRTTPAQLRQACRGWRDPLDTPTGNTEMLRSWDPEPGKPTPEYALRDLPGPSIEMEGMQSLGVDSLIPLIDGDDSASTLAARKRPPLIHPEEGPWLLEIPLALVTKLAALDDAAVPELGPRWAAALRRDKTDVVEDWLYVAALTKLVGFARETLAAGHRMYEWRSLPSAAPAPAPV